jgi:carboxypeptidase C (cathepsin A)
MHCMPHIWSTMSPKARSKTSLALALAATICVGLAAPSFAQEHGGGAERSGRRGGGNAEQQEPRGPGVLKLLPSDSVTEHTVDTATGPIAYTATAGTLSFYDQSGELSAKIFYTAYIAKGRDAAKRPLTFVFNGGPGAASAFLTLGLVGPRLIQFGADGRDGAGAHLRDNPETWLGFTDIVAIDPVGAGWSRAAKADNAKDFWNVRSDANAMAKAVALYVAHNSRSVSPKYILGESYGGFRAAKVARALQQDQGIVISGIVMISPMLEGAFQFGSDNFPLGAAFHLPSLAAAHMERKHALDTTAVKAAEHFAMTDYLTTLAGTAPQGNAATAFYKRVSQMTGIDEATVARTRGFLKNAGQKNLSASDTMLASQYDGGFLTSDPFPESASARGPDPQLDGFLRAFGGVFSGYARDELGFKTDMTFNLLSNEVSGQWNWREGGARSTPSVGDDLRILLAFNPSFRLVIAHGYSDLVTPYMASKYVIGHLPSPEDAARAALLLYPGGHMHYLSDASRKAFTKDMRSFYAAGAT